MRRARRAVPTLPLNQEKRDDASPIWVRSVSTCACMQRKDRVVTSRARCFGCVPRSCLVFVCVSIASIASSMAYCTLAPSAAAIARHAPCGTAASTFARKRAAEARSRCKRSKAFLPTRRPRAAAMSPSRAPPPAASARRRVAPLLAMTTLL